MRHICFVQLRLTSVLHLQALLLIALKVPEQKVETHGALQIGILAVATGKSLEVFACCRGQLFSGYHIIAVDAELHTLLASKIIALFCAFVVYSHTYSQQCTHMHGCW